VGKTPDYFKKYPLEEVPGDLFNNVKYMDLYWELYGKWEQYGMKNISDDFDHDDATFGGNFNLLFSEIARVSGGFSTRWRSHTNESVAKNILNFDENRLFITLTQYLSRTLKLRYYGDFTNYNYLNAAGYDYNEIVNMLKFTGIYRPYIRWILEFRNNSASYDVTNSVFPDTQRFTIKYSWTRNFGEDKAFTLFGEIVDYGVDGKETGIYSDYVRNKLGVLLSRRITDTISMDFGIVKSDTTNATFKENDVDESYVHTSTRWVF